MQTPWEHPGCQHAAAELATLHLPGLEGETASADAFGWVLSSVLRGELPVAFHYQPIVDLKRGAVAGYEALARFPNVLGPTPDLCFAAAARVGKRLELEQVVARTVLFGRALLPPDTFYSINLSAAFLVSERWQQVLATVTDLVGVVIEITEEESIGDYVNVRNRLSQIRDLGGCIAVDDAGSGYASLQHVVEMKPSFVKLDRQLVGNCHIDPAKAVVIEMIGQAANRLDAWIIAEGIESQQELDKLIRLGLPLGQGYHLGRPEPVMQSLGSGLAAAIRSRLQKQTGTNTLLPLIETCPSAPTRDAAQRLLCPPGSSAAPASACLIACVVDQWSRPLQVIERHPLLGVRVLPEPMKIQLSNDPSEVLLRALTRDAASRFDPLTVIDGRGQLQGIVPMDRLMRAVLDHPAPRT
jgi:EAL domain-containing protein (putative c-di-GMP-specific phosphodiesterase class I)